MPTGADAPAVDPIVLARLTDGALCAGTDLGLHGNDCQQSQ
jgi:hypothetical protein